MESKQTRRMPLVYVAGPFRGSTTWVIEGNIRRGEALALRVWKMGASALSPHCNTRFFQGECSDDTFLQGDLEVVRRCDAILMMEDWMRSAGARDERDFADEIGIPIFYATHMHELADFIADWVRHKEGWANPPTAIQSDAPCPVP